MVEASGLEPPAYWIFDFRDHARREQPDRVTVMGLESLEPDLHVADGHRHIVNHDASSWSLAEPVCAIRSDSDDVFLSNAPLGRSGTLR
jgi:hypothetical protein